MIDDGDAFAIELAAEEREIDVKPFGANLLLLRRDWPICATTVCRATGNAYEGFGFYTTDPVVATWCGDADEFVEAICRSHEPALEAWQWHFESST